MNHMHDGVLNKKRLLDVIRASRPVIFYNDYKGYEYSITGTSFLCEFNQWQFIVTAKHVLKDFDPEGICIPFHYESREFLPYTCVCTPEGNDPEEIDKFDIAVLPLAKKFGSIELQDQGPFRLSSETIEIASDPGKNLILRGFPDTTNKIDYDRKAICLEGNSFGATIVGASIITGCVEIEFNDLSQCDSVNGLSGAPIFSINSLIPPYEVRFAGMLLRATKTSSRGHMLSASIVLKMLHASVARIKSDFLSDVDIK